MPYSTTFLTLDGIMSDPHVWFTAYDSDESVRGRRLFDQELPERALERSTRSPCRRACVTSPTGRHRDRGRQGDRLTTTQGCAVTRGAPWRQAARGCAAAAVTATVAVAVSPLTVTDSVTVPVRRPTSVPVVGSNAAV